MRLEVASVRLPVDVGVLVDLITALEAEQRWTCLRVTPPPEANIEMLVITAEVTE